MKVLSLEDFVSIFQEIDVDDMDVYVSIPSHIDLSARCYMFGTMMEMEL